MSHDHFIEGRWVEGTGPALSSQDPATGQVVWQGHAAAAVEVDAAVAAARRAATAWADQSVDSRTAILKAFAAVVQQQRQSLALAICRETGKPKWEALAEADLVARKVDVSLRSYTQRCAVTAVKNHGVTQESWFRPHGVCAVLGPFNFPAHLPNGHLVPALLAGNTVVFKPSELTPGVGAELARLFAEAGLPSGVLNVVQGGAETGVALAGHTGIDGLFFTGSAATGKSLAALLAPQPRKILALEMGGNNPLVAWDVADLEGAALCAALSAFVTTGQRCTCARRLILQEGAPATALLQRLERIIAGIRIGPWTAEPEPFMGPLIHPTAADRVMAAQDDLLIRGGKAIVLMRRLAPAFVSPGVIDVTAIAEAPDAEIFGPLLQVTRVGDFDTAIAAANRTGFGLAAGLLSDDPALWQKFRQRVRAGVVNWNRQTTHASSELPFGGAGDSGNHRPSAFFAADYCSWPVASLQTPKVTTPVDLPPGLSTGDG